MSQDLRDHPSLRRRPAGAVFADVAARASWSRNWLVFIVVIAVVIAAALATATQAAVPWVVYPAL